MCSHWTYGFWAFLRPIPYLLQSFPMSSPIQISSNNTSKWCVFKIFLSLSSPLLSSENTSMSPSTPSKSQGAFSCFSHCSKLMSHSLLAPSCSSCGASHLLEQSPGFCHSFAYIPCSNKEGSSKWLPCKWQLLWMLQTGSISFLHPNPCSCRYFQDSAQFCWRSGEALFTICLQATSPTYLVSHWTPCLPHGQPCPTGIAGWLRPFKTLILNSFQLPSCWILRVFKNYIS